MNSTPESTNMYVPDPNFQGEDNLSITTEWNPQNMVAVVNDSYN